MLALDLTSFGIGDGYGLALAETMSWLDHLKVPTNPEPGADPNPNRSRARLSLVTPTTNNSESLTQTNSKTGIESRRQQTD